MKKIIYVTMLLSLFPLVLTNCGSKEDPVEALETKQLTLDKDTYNQGEIAILLSPMGISDIQVLFDAQTTVTLTKVDNNFALYIPADLPAGKHTLDITADNESYSINFTVIEGQDIADPKGYLDDYVDNTTQILNKVNENLSELEDQTLYANDRDTLTKWLNILKSQLASASSSDQKAAAQFIAANSAWMDEVHQANLQLTSSLLKLKKAEVDDYESDVKAASLNYLAAKAVLISKGPWMIGLIAVSGGIGSLVAPGPGTIAGVKIGAGLAAVILLKDFSNVYVAQNKLLNIIFLPFEKMVAKSKKSTITFDKGVYTDIDVSANYRSLKRGDESSQLQVVKVTVSAFGEVINFWNKINDVLPGDLDYKPKNLNATSISEEKEIHSKYLTIENVSSTTMSYKIDRTNGEFKVKWSSSKEMDEDFAFDIKYTNPEFGSFKTSVIGEYIEEEPEPLSGRWITEPFFDEVAHDTDDYKYYSTIFNFTGMNCKCLTVQNINLNTNKIFLTASGYCIQKDKNLNKYYFSESETCPPTVTPDEKGEITVISKTENELKIRIRPISGGIRAVTLTPY